MSAKNEKLSKKLGLVSAEMPEIPTRLVINLDKFSGFSGKDIGDKCRAIIEGKVSRIQKDSDFNELTLEITKIDKYKSSDSHSADKSQESEDYEDE